MLRCTPAMVPWFESTQSKEKGPVIRGRGDKIKITLRTGVEEVPGSQGVGGVN